jgi:CRISPR-associated protein Cmr4
MINKGKQMGTNSAILGLWAETSIHAGAGSSVDGVDLPIQREGHSGWPCIFGSAVKGALRAKAEQKWGRKNSVKVVFGPEPTEGKASEHAGALMVGDARLLLLPVRSLTGHFKWVTCPALLTRLVRDAKRMGIEATDCIVPELAENKAVQQSKAADLFLEEYKVSVEAMDLSGIIKTLSALSGIEAGLLEKQLVIVDDGLFAYLSRYTTPVVAHIAIDSDKKVVRKGALWYEETLPPETVLYTTVSASKVRDPSFKNNNELADNQAAAVFNSITETLFNDSPYLQIGGNETVGMGWCKVNTYTGA